MAGRVSLVEEYENKDMIIQMKKCLDDTSAAVEASETARDTAIAAAGEAHVASDNANAASQRANQASATVEVYDNRLSTVEGTVQGHGAEIQHLGIETQTLFDRDANNVKVEVDHVQNVVNGLNLGGINRVSNTTVGELNDMIVNAKRLIEEIDAKLNAYDQMVRTSGNQTIAGVKTIGGQFNLVNRPVYSLTNGNLDSSEWVKVYSWVASTTQRMLWVDMFDRLNGRTARYLVSGAEGNGNIHRDMGANTLDGNLKLAYRDGTITLFTNKRRATFNVVINVIGSAVTYFDINIENMQVPVDEPTTDTYVWVAGVTE